MGIINDLIQLSFGLFFLLFGLVSFIASPFVLVINLFKLRRSCGMRLHLSTAIILLLSTGILLGANLTRHRGAHYVWANRETIDVQANSFGFPFMVYVTVDSKTIPAGTTLGDVDFTYVKLPDGDYYIQDDVIPLDYVMGFWNVIFAMATLSWVWLVCERRIQRLTCEKKQSSTQLKIA